MIIKEARLMAVNRGKYGDLSIRLLVKPEDYSLEDYLALHDQAREGQTGAVVWETFNTDGQPAEKKKKEASVYARFRSEVMRDFGIEAYNKVKQRLGVEHLVELEKDGDNIAQVAAILDGELIELRREAGWYDGMN
jgi:hypothetical protein